jgi:hypothetical protein
MVKDKKKSFASMGRKKHLSLSTVRKRHKYVNYRTGTRVYEDGTDKYLIGLGRMDTQPNYS